MIRENDIKIIGMVNIRYNISKDKLKTWATHIGYGIRLTERKNKTILALGSKLEKTELYPFDNIMTNYYWISVNNSIEKHSKYSKKYIINI